MGWRTSSQPRGSSGEGSVWCLPPSSYWPMAGSAASQQRMRHSGCSAVPHHPAALSCCLCLGLVFQKGAMNTNWRSWKQSLLIQALTLWGCVWQEQSQGSVNTNTCCRHVSEWWCEFNLWGLRAWGLQHVAVKPCRGTCYKAGIIEYINDASKAASSRRTGMEAACPSVHTITHVVTPRYLSVILL